jgi:acyl-CoA synthetase (AMP-forming)/AMP-acid ligase II
MLDELRRRRERAPGTVAVRAGTPKGWVETTWARLYGMALGAAAGARELPPGPVAVLVDGGAASAATVLGLCAAGRDVVLLEAKTSLLADGGSAARRARPSIVVGPEGTDPALLGGIGFRAYERCRAAVPEGAHPAGAGGEVLQLTSGSTGEAKLVRQPLANVRIGGDLYRRAFGLGEGDAILAAVPLAHSFGLVGALAAAVVSGAALWPLTPFSLRRLLAGLADGATTLLGTPLVYAMLAPVPSGDLPRLRTALSSGGPLGPAVAAEAARRLGRRVRQVYGSTEAGLIAYEPDDPDWPAEAVGVAAPGVRLRLAPAAGAPAGAGALLVRTRTLFRGYLDGTTRPAPSASTATQLTVDGFYATGDLAAVDERGRLFLLGRKDTFVNVGGRKVNPRRIERILAEHRGVREVFVFGFADPGAEELLHAAVVLAAGTSVRDVVAHCRSRRLMPYEVPHRFHVVPGLPRTALGKVDRQGVIAATAGHDESEG